MGEIKYMGYKSFGLKIRGNIHKSCTFICIHCLHFIFILYNKLSPNVVS